MKINANNFRPILKHVYASLSNRLQLSIFVSRQKKKYMVLSCIVIIACRRICCKSGLKYKWSRKISATFWLRAPRFSQILRPIGDVSLALFPRLHIRCMKKAPKTALCAKETKKNRKPFGFRHFLVEVTGFEPATFWSRTKRATKLRYTSEWSQ